MTNKIFFLLLISVFSIKIYSQAYYGKNNFGKFQFLNDSVCTVSFTDVPGWPRIHIIDTCNYIRKNDTIFISTKIRNKFEIVKSDTPFNLSGNEPILLKVYKKKKKNYFLETEYLYGVKLDTSSKSVTISNTYLEKGDLVVLYFYASYSRFEMKYSSSEYLLIKLNELETFQTTFFDSFPIIIKRNKLIPLDGQKQHQCWVENGFYFPTMKFSRNEKNYHGIFYNKIGIKGLSR